MKPHLGGLRAARTVAGLVTSFLLLGQASCSSPNPAAGPSVAADGGGFPASAYTTVTSSSGALTIAVRTAPQPPVVGTDEVELTITNTGDGTPVDGLTLSVEPWMPAMGHGTATTTVTPQGDGVYLVTDVYLFMQGLWALRTTISGSMSDDASPQLQIQ